MSAFASAAWALSPANVDEDSDLLEQFLDAAEVCVDMEAVRVGARTAVGGASLKAEAASVRKDMTRAICTTSSSAPTTMVVQEVVKRRLFILFTTRRESLAYLILAENI